MFANIWLMSQTSDWLDIQIDIQMEYNISEVKYFFVGFILKSSKLWRV